MKKTVQFIFGIFLMALAFNVFITEVNTVNGMTGIGLIFNKKFALNASLVILIGNIFCLLLSVIFLGIDITKNSIIGSILYDSYGRWRLIALRTNVNNTNPLPGIKIIGSNNSFFINHVHNNNIGYEI